MSCRSSSTLPRRFGRWVIQGFQWLSAFCFAFEIPPRSFGPKGSKTHCNTSPSSTFWFCLSACCSETSNIWSSGQTSVLPPLWGIPHLRAGLSSDLMTIWPRPAGSNVSGWIGTVGPELCDFCGTKELQRNQRSLGFSETVGIRSWATSRENPDNGQGKPQNLIEFVYREVHKYPIQKFMVPQWFLTSRPRRPSQH